MAVDHFERILDPTARIPGRTYWCCSHVGFNEVHDPNNGGHYPPLPDDVLCSDCVRWEDLCDQWITVGTPDRACASVRCQRAGGHNHMHLVDDLDGQRFSWSDDSPFTFKDTTIRYAETVGDSWVGTDSDTPIIFSQPITVNAGDSASWTWTVNLT